jgi:Domain of unknown function DUF29
MSTELADPDLYERDFYLWAQRQAAELRRAAQHRVNLPLDLGNLAEEIESLGRSDRRAVINYLATVIEPLLKLGNSPAQQPRAGWMRSVRNARAQLRLILRDSPSLVAAIPELLGDAYEIGAAEAEAGLRKYKEFVSLPRSCPYEPDQLLDANWWPEGQAPE